MDIIVRLRFDERGALRLLNWLAWENAVILTQRPDVPRLYDTSVRYQRERKETWSDCLETLAAGWEDCDSLAAWRAGELMARGQRAMLPFDPGYEAASGLENIAADCIIKTRSPAPGGQYHCVTRYWIGKREYYDDPSARLGMNGRWDSNIVRRRKRMGKWHASSR